MKTLENLVPSNFFCGVPFYSEASEIESAMNSNFCDGVSFFVDTWDLDSFVKENCYAHNLHLFGRI